MMCLSPSRAAPNISLGTDMQQQKAAARRTLPAVQRRR